MSKKASKVSNNSSQSTKGPGLFSTIITKSSVITTILGVVAWGLIPPIFFYTYLEQASAGYWCLIVAMLFLIIPTAIKWKPRYDLLLPSVVFAYFSSMTEPTVSSVITIVFCILSVFAFISTISFVSSQFTIASPAERYQHRHDDDYIFESQREKNDKKSASKSNKSEMDNFQDPNSDDFGMVSKSDPDRY